METILFFGILHVAFVRLVCCTLLCTRSVRLSSPATASRHDLSPVVMAPLSSSTIPLGYSPAVSVPMCVCWVHTGTCHRAQQLPLQEAYLSQGICPTDCLPEPLGLLTAALPGPLSTHSLPGNPQGGGRSIISHLPFPRLGSFVLQNVFEFTFSMFFFLVLGEEWNPVADTWSFLEIAVYLDAFENKIKIQFNLCNNLQSLHEVIK